MEGIAILPDILSRLHVGFRGMVRYNTCLEKRGGGVMKEGYMYLYLGCNVLLVRSVCTIPG